MWYVLNKSLWKNWKEEKDLQFGLRLLTLIRENLLFLALAVLCASSDIIKSNLVELILVALITAPNESYVENKNVPNH